MRPPSRNPRENGRKIIIYMNEEKQYYVYIMASERNGTLYTGITSNLADRANKHKQGAYDGFTKKYKINKLVYYEIYGDVREAISREKQLKDWKRNWKIDNPNKIWFLIIF